MEEDVEFGGQGQIEGIGIQGKVLGRLGNGGEAMVVLEFGGEGHAF
jgi:hypothetical protein